MMQRFPLNESAHLWPMPQVYEAAELSWLAGSDPSQSGDIEQAGFTVTADDGAVRRLCGFWERFDMDNTGDIHGNGDPMIWQASLPLQRYGGEPGLIALLDAYLEEGGEDASGASVEWAIDPHDGVNRYCETLSWNQTSSMLEVVCTIGQQNYGPYGYGAKDVRRMQISYGYRTEFSETDAEIWETYGNEVRLVSFSVGSYTATSLRLIPPGGFFAERAAAYVNGHVLPLSDSYTATVTLSVPAGKAQSFWLLGCHVLHNRRRIAETAPLLVSPSVKMAPSLA